MYRLKLETHLGLRTSSNAAWAGMFSLMVIRDMILCRSLWARAGSLARLPLASAGFVAKSRGTGPLADSPANMAVEVSHSAARTVGTPSLNNDGTCV